MYTYELLNRDKAEIRLIALDEQELPVGSDCENDVPLNLQLRQHSLNEDEHPYAALSYVWGDVRNQERVYVHINGAPFSVTRGLHDSLVALFHTHHASWLWVDAVCINQTDLAEKSWQVAQMREIFSRADLVYMLIGSATANTDMAMELISRYGSLAVAAGALRVWRFWDNRYNREEEDLRNYFEFRSSATREQVESGSVPGDSALSRLAYDIYQDRLLHPHLSGESSALVAGILELLRKEYWHRVWIIQEVTLASKGLVVCGSSTVALEEFEAVTLTIFCVRRHCERAPGVLKSFIGDATPNNYENIPLRLRRRHHNSAPTEMASVLYQKMIAPGRPYYSASDPRDIVFALMGVVSDGDKLELSIDYRRTSAEVLSSVTRAFLRKRTNFTLDCCMPTADEDRSPGMPSWVPDWERIGRHGDLPYPIAHTRGFHAAGGHHALPKHCDKEVDPYAPVLQCLGCHVDVITDVMEPPEWLEKLQSPWLTSYNADVDSYLASIANFAGLGDETGPGEDYIWRTLMQGEPHVLYGLARMPHPGGQALLRLTRRIMRRKAFDAGTISAEENDLIQAESSRLGALKGLNFDTPKKMYDEISHTHARGAGIVNRQRTFFKTAKGMFGLGHVTIKSGDLVTLISDVASPIILRTGRDTGTFTFQGDAYVDGIMFGEFLINEPPQRMFNIA